jgi:hypothetical protein
VEAAVLRQLYELDAASIFPDQGTANRRRLEAMKTDLDQIETDLNGLNDEMA